MQISHKTCRSGAAGRAGSPPPNGRMRFHSRGIRGPRAPFRPSPAPRRAVNPQWSGVRGEPRGLQSPVPGGNDPRSCLPAAAPPGRPSPTLARAPGPFAQIPPARLPRWSRLLNPGCHANAFGGFFLKIGRDKENNKRPPKIGRKNNLNKKRKWQVAPLIVWHSPSQGKGVNVRERVVGLLVVRDTELQDSDVARLWSSSEISGL